MRPSSSSPRGPASLHGNDEQVAERRTLRDYYIILRERLWIALPAAILAAVGMGYYQMRETPMYSATATIQYERSDTITTGRGVNG